MDTYKKGLTHDSLYLSILDSVERMKKQRVSRSDLKIIEKAIKELRYTFKVFAPYESKRKVTVFGSARSRRNDPDYKLARKFSKQIVQKGFMVLTGAGPGIMHAAQEGAGSKKSFGLNIILPFEQSANPVIRGDTKLINFKYFFTRKLTMVKESDALVLFPGGYGTQDELFETLTLLQTGKSTPKPVVLIEKKGGHYWKAWKKFSLDMLVRQKLVSKQDLSLVYFTHSTSDAVAHVTRFYRNYHSLRYYDKWLLIRVWRMPPKTELKRLSKKFRDILKSGIIHSSPTHVSYDPKLKKLGLKTVRLDFTQRHFGRLRELIDDLNQY